MGSLRGWERIVEGMVKVRIGWNRGGEFVARRKRWLYRPGRGGLKIASVEMVFRYCASTSVTTKYCFMSMLC